MDKHISVWLLEFLARKQISPRLLNGMFTNPHFSVRETNNPRLKRTICLNTIQEKIANGDVASELILESLEIIEELDRREGSLVTDSLKLAYLAVAVECTVKYLRIPGSPQQEDQGQFFEAVKRIWRERIGKMDQLKKSELVTKELRELKGEMEAALEDSKARERLMGRVGQAEALRLVRVYVNEALVIMGPSFIELATRAEMELKRKRKYGDKIEMKERNKPNTAPELAVADGPVRQELKRKRKNGDEVETEEGSKPNADPELVVLDGSPRQELKKRKDGDKVGMEEGTDPELVVLDGPPRQEIGGMQQQNGVFEACFPESSHDVMDSQNVETSIPSTKFSFNLVPTPKFVKVREALKHSWMELHALVNDPLPEALRVSDALRAEIREKSLNKEISVENQNGNNIDAPRPAINAEASGAAKEISNPVPSQVNQNMKTNAEIRMSSHQVVAAQRSLMEHNTTACTSEVPEVREISLNKETSVENQNGNDIDAPRPAINAEASGAAKEISNPVPSQVNQNRKTNAEIPMSSHQGVAAKCSLMEHNSTTCTSGVPEIREKSLNKETSVENQNGNDIDAPRPAINAEVSEASKKILNPGPSQIFRNMETNAEIPTSSHQIIPPKRSLMERNSTAFTYEWSDSIDGISPEGTPENSRKKVGPCKVKNFAARRRPNKWSLQEEEELTKGVKRYGTGNWKLILNFKRDIFIDRTAVDLKDKWRNMTRFGDPLKELEKN
ncbi:uncharacterized protein [Euphorbia lathyris]|uniref:uncharacterized protein n=1 Tax=Euphorbia lathyris TaxID=212925 RepID=UPI003313664E